MKLTDEEMWSSAFAVPTAVSAAVTDIVNYIVAVKGRAYAEREGLDEDEPTSPAQRARDNVLADLIPFIEEEMRAGNLLLISEREWNGQVGWGKESKFGDDVFVSKRGIAADARLQRWRKGLPAHFTPDQVDEFIRRNKAQLEIVRGVQHRARGHGRPRARVPTLC